MANLHRGELSATFNNKTYVLCLTLGALAELESAFQVKNIGALANYFAQNTLSASDMIKIITIAIRAGGTAITEKDVASFTLTNGVHEFASVIEKLFALSFAITPPDETYQQNPLMPQSPYQ